MRSEPVRAGKRSRGHPGGGRAGRRRDEAAGRRVSGRRTSRNPRPAVFASTHTPDHKNILYTVIIIIMKNYYPRRARLGIVYNNNITVVRHTRVGRCVL